MLPFLSLICEREYRVYTPLVESSQHVKISAVKVDCFSIKRRMIQRSSWKGTKGSRQVLR